MSSSGGRRWEQVDTLDCGVGVAAAVGVRCEGLFSKGFQLSSIAVGE